MHGGQLEIRFFARKISEVEPIRLDFGSLMGGIGAHIYNFFQLSHFHITREIVDFRQNFGIFFLKNGPTYSCRNFTTDGPWGSPYNALENLDPPPKIFEKLEENFFGGGPPRGAWGRNLRGRL